MTNALRIGIDARAASHPQPGGFKAYAAGLIGGLAGLELAHEITLYVDRPYQPARPWPPNFGVRVVPAGPKLLGAGFREQITLPLRLAQARAQVSHFPYNTAPFFAPGKRIVTIHDLILLHPVQARNGSHPSLHHRLMNAYSRFFLIQAARTADAIITDSQFSADEIARSFPRQASRLHVVPLAAAAVFRAVEPGLAAERAREQFNLASGYVLVVGSSDPRKNALSAIGAYAQLPAGLRQAHPLVVVLAHASLQPELERRCQDLGIAAQTVFLTSLTHPQMHIVYSAAAVFVFPSLFEGFGMPPLEAMACGTPVVTSNTSSIPEVTGDAALLVAPTDVSALCGAIETTLTDAALAGRLRAGGLRRAARFSWAETARQTVAVYERVGRA